MKEPLLDTLERKCRKFTIRNLMWGIVIGTALVWLLDYVVGLRAGVYVSWYLQFDKERILRGEVWRVITFVFVPRDNRPFYFIISMYFYWFIGTGLERAWGSFRFDIFYFLGVLCNVVCGFIVGVATVEYLHLSMFIAYAIVNPNDRVLLFFIIPIKMKWLAIFDAVLLAVDLVLLPWEWKIAILIAFLNLAIFFTKSVVQSIQAFARRKKWQKQWKIEAGKKTDEKSENKDSDDPFEL